MSRSHSGHLCARHSSYLWRRSSETGKPVFFNRAEQEVSFHLEFLPTPVATHVPLGELFTSSVEQVRIPGPSRKQPKHGTQGNVGLPVTTTQRDCESMRPGRPRQVQPGSRTEKDHVGSVERPRPSGADLAASGHSRVIAPPNFCGLSLVGAVGCTTSRCSTL